MEQNAMRKFYDLVNSVRRNIAPSAVLSCTMFEKELAVIRHSLNGENVDRLQWQS